MLKRSSLKAMLSGEYFPYCSTPPRMCARRWGIAMDAIPNLRPIGPDDRCCSSLSAEVSPTYSNRHNISLLMATLHLRCQGLYFCQEKLQA